MAKCKEEAVRNIRSRLEKSVLLRTEMDNPYVEKYIDEVIVAIVDEIFSAINDREKSIASDLRMGIRSGRF